MHVMQSRMAGSHFLHLRQRRKGPIADRLTRAVALRKLQTVLQVVPWSLYRPIRRRIQFLESSVIVNLLSGTLVLV